MLSYNKSRNCLSAREWCALLRGPAQRGWQCLPWNKRGRRSLRRACTPTEQPQLVGDCVFRLLTILSLLVLALCFGANGVLAQATGQLQGQVVNRTEGGAVPGDAPVTLLVLKEMAIQDELAARADSEGRFRFEGLDTSANTAYQVMVQYKGVNYFSDFLMFEGGKIPTVTVDVYEPTQDSANVHAERVHVIVNVRPRQLQVGEMHVFSNSGDRVYIGPSSELSGTLRFGLPVGATNLQFQEGELGGRFLKVDDGFVDTAPVLPGTGSHQVLFSYNLSYESPQFSFAVTDYYTATGVNVLVSDPAVQVSSPVLESEGLRDMQGQQWVSLAGKNLPAGQEILLALSNLPLEQRERPALPAGTAGPASRMDSVRLIVLAAAVFGLGVLVGYNLPRRQQSAQGSSLPSRETAAETAEWSDDDLVMALADLDDAFERDEIPPDEYHQRRESLKKRLASQMKRK